MHIFNCINLNLLSAFSHPKERKKEESRPFQSSHHLKATVKLCAIEGVARRLHVSGHRFTRSQALGHQDRWVKYQMPNTRIVGPSTKCQIPNTRYQIPGQVGKIPNAKYQIPNTKYQIPNTKFQIPNTKYQNKQL